MSEELSIKKSTIESMLVRGSKHSAGKEKIAKGWKQEMEYDAVVHPSGETLPDSLRVYRVKVLWIRCPNQDLFEQNGWL